MELAENYTDSVGLGEPIFYDVTFNLPYRTAASVDIYSESTSGPIEVCRLAVIFMSTFPNKYFCSEAALWFRVSCNVLGGAGANHRVLSLSFNNCHI